jgi:hypothetical protein
VSALAQLQGDFARWLQGREPPAETPRLLGDARASAAERLHVYRYAYMSRLVGVLREDFPALERALGRDAFDPLAAAYLRENPSRHFSLRHAGARFPAFLAQHEAARETRARAPFAPDLARFELAVTDAFDAADARPLLRGDLAHLAPDAWADLSLALMPGAQFLELAWPVRALRAAYDAEQPHRAEAIAPASERVLVWRKAERVLHRACDAEELALLARVASGLRFGELCAHAAEARGEEGGAAFAASLLATWVDAELLRGE